MMINGIQYCTDGWIVGEVGNHAMSIEYPKEWRDVNVALKPREPFNLEFVVTASKQPLSRTVVITWINSSDHDVAFDYAITEK